MPTPSTHSGEYFMKTYESTFESHPMLPARAIVPALLMALCGASGAQTVSGPPYVQAYVGVTGTTHDSGAVNWPSVSETASVTGTVPGGSTFSASGDASADASGTLKV